MRDRSRPTLLRELAFGSGKPEPFRLLRLHALEDGKISMSALFVALAFFVTIGFVGNAEMAVFRKIEAQNAADSMALTASTWRARGLNAVTANNHLMGELTAVLVVIEGLGGPELDGVDEPSPIDESVQINDAISDPAFGSIGGFGGEGTVLEVLVPVWGSIAAETQFARADKEYVDFLHKTFTDDKGRHDAGATIYDGQMSMKILIWYGFGTKLASNAVYFVVSAVSLGSAEGIAAATNLGVHLAIDGAMIAVVKDWYLTKGVIVFARMLQPLRDPVLPVALQGLSLYGDSLADEFQVRNAIEENLKASRQEFGVESFRTFPRLAEIELPVREEPPPESNGPASIPPSLSDRRPEEPPEVRFIKAPLGTLKASIDTINDLIPDFLDADIDIGVAPGFRLEAKSIPQQDGGGFGFKGNFSLKHLGEYARDENVDWQRERASQWVRATYPHVDELRRPLCAFFEKVIPTSAMSTYLVHWTNRYTISASHRLRTDGEGRHLYVLEDGRPDAKGNEPWTANPPRAEELFAVQLFVKVETPRAILTPPFFPNPNKKGVMALAESMVYNANGRRVTGPTNLPGPRQPDTGWDTLNWTPPVVAPEWGGAQESDPGDMDRAISLFSTGAKQQGGSASRVQLNWQSKLSPVGEKRLRAALLSPEVAAFFERTGNSSLLPDPSMVLH